ncbi:hypothetical protein F4779DRAFT_634268 [Xylariaceae sp. FL0662B]|nr:hypothetical protein F4779DRAFT_634268 [Xylariaceae sp. FL0662B]
MDTTTTGTAIRTTQLLGLTSSIFLSGINFSASHLTLPILYTQAPSASTPAFAQLYHRGARTVVPLAVFSTLCAALAASQAPSALQRGVWAAAAATTFATLPFTRLVMMETNWGLLRLAELAEQKGGKGNGTADADGGGEKAEVVRLLRRWKRLNMVRSALAATGGLIAAYAVVFRV